VNYFGQVNQFYPNMRDATGVTGAQRYREALLNYGDQQATAKKLGDRCQALDSWGAANSIAPLDEDYLYKFNRLNLECNPPTPTIDPASLITPTVEVPTTEPPTVEPPTTEPPTAEPSLTSTP
jgi:hypothetical protein